MLVGSMADFVAFLRANVSASGPGRDVYEAVLTAIQLAIMAGILPDAMFFQHALRQGVMVATFQPEGKDALTDMLAAAQDAGIPLDGLR